VVFKPSLEELSERLALALDIGAVCEAWSESSHVVNSQMQASDVDVNTDSLAVTTDFLVHGEPESVSADSIFIDPDGSGMLNEEDILFMLHVINDDGLGPYSPLFRQPLERDYISGADLAEEQHAMRWNACDIDRDTFLSPLDVLLVINEINAKNNS
jgi:hypothetical protein